MRILTHPLFLPCRLLRVRYYTKVGLVSSGRPTILERALLELGEGEEPGR